MSIKFGVSPIAWINDDMPELGGDTPVEAMLADARDLGFSGIELGGKFPRDVAILRSLLDRYELDLIGGWYSSNLLTQSAKDEIAALQPHLSLLKALDSPVFVMAETSNAFPGQRQEALHRSPVLARDDWQGFGSKLSELADYIADSGLSLAYHHHLGTAVETAEELDRFFSATGPNVGLTLDTGHASLGGINALDVIRTVPERVVHVHCKDVRTARFDAVTTNKRSFLDGVLDGMFTVPGDGDLDFGAVMKALAGINYSGWIVIEAEQDPAIADPREYARIGLETLRKEAAAASLEEVR